MMHFVSILMMLLLSLTLGVVIKSSYELGKKRLFDHKEIKCPTDRVDPEKSHGNQEPA